MMVLDDRMDLESAPTAALLLARATDGDTQAFAELYTRYLPVGRNVARRWGAKHEVDDIVHDVMAQIWSLLLRGAGPTDNFGAYLATAVRHACGRRAVLAARTRSIDDMDRRDQGSLGNASVDGELEDFVITFRCLPDEHRDLLWQLHVEGWSPRELAVLSGRTPNAVSAMASRARRTVRSAMATMV